MAPVAATSAGAIGIGAAILVSLAVAYFASERRSSKKKSSKGLVDAIGNTPLIRINSLSDATGCHVSPLFPLPSFTFKLQLIINLCNIFPLQILGKCEFLNPGGSVKDRVAVQIIEEVNSLLVYLFIIFFFKRELVLFFVAWILILCLIDCAGYKIWTAASRRNCY